MHYLFEPPSKNCTTRAKPHYDRRYSSFLTLCFRAGKASKFSNLLHVALVRHRSDYLFSIMLLIMGRLKTPDLTSRERTTRHHKARVDIARLVSMFQYMLTTRICMLQGVLSRAVRRRTGGRRRRWVVLWPAAAARHAFFIGGGGVALWSAAAASDRTSEQWNSALVGQAFFFWFYRGQPLHLWSLLGR